MKRALFIVMMVWACITYGQKKVNGTIYVEHPAIIAVEAMQQAFIKGDSVKVASFLTDDFKAYYGSNTNKEDKGRDKKQFISQVRSWKNNFDYVSLKRSEGAYPDAIEYKDGKNDDVTWVQTWDHLKGIHNKTGVSLDMPIHRLFIVNNKDNKIKTMINYADPGAMEEIGNSYTERKNGVIYNNHEYINKVRLMIHAFENKDFKKAYSFYDKNAQFRSCNMAVDEKSLTLDQMKEMDKIMFEKYDITSIDVVGYPDYLNYDLGNQKVVQSWWNMRLTRKADNKKIVLPILFIDTFNDSGLIVDEIAYYSESLLAK
ncbi:nuclear transport factor 2 family protein [Flavobacterium sp. GT3R68]|uniref:nuclear transport factor 2 family protein n=1 Tax=Flavobacterium sp. GT3R68 TaxID=2594437 RepID=UPI000F874C6B|nr:nuclear transport factor 2 family protein [Flavobacterium sp. GT3R68]RTY95156.1 nuclear transport factor 2 family protein [Flavobacterium sp. GSN2]TRW91102.1 nuclear transport factor 2 family protein [Flavobacterium sp. GT3R68]